MPTRIISNIIDGRPLISGTSDMTVRSACRLMAEKKIGALLVIDNNRIAGIFTERDALNKVLAGDLDPVINRLRLRIGDQDPVLEAGARTLIVP